MFERFSREARRAVERALAEAVAMRHDHVGTEHLLLALTDPDSAASRILESFNVDRVVLLHEYGRTGDLGEFALSQHPDPDALVTLGIDIEEVRRRVEDEFGLGALERTAAWRPRGRPRFSSRAKRSLHSALREAIALGHRRLQSEHLLLGLAAVEDGLAARLLAGRGATLARLRAVVADEYRRSA